MLNFPAPLRPGDLIAVTAPSSGVPAPLHARLDLVVAHLRAQGYRVVEGACLRAEHKDASAPAAERAAELMRFLTDPAVAAVLPPWGGELATELLDRLDFEALRGLPPKWLLGFSDLSTLQLPLALCSGWASAHGANLMDLVPSQTDPLTTQVMAVLAADWREPVLQRPGPLYQGRWGDFAARHDVPLLLSEPVAWQRLDGSATPLSLQGHLIGGCIDTIAWLAGTRYGAVPDFIRTCGTAGTLLYLENCELNPPTLARALWSLRRQGWFDGLTGLLIGRNSGPEALQADGLAYRDALNSALGELACPVLIDLDIGHKMPQFTLINGALATVSFADGRGVLLQGR